MGKLFVIRIGIFTLAALFAWQVWAQTPELIYGQRLVEKAAASHPELLELSLYASNAKGADPVIVATVKGKMGRNAEPGAVKAMTTGEPVFSTAGDRLTVDLQLQDVSKRPVGILEAILPSKPADDRSALLETATSIRDGMARRISHVKNLLEPAQFDPALPADTYGQALVDEALAANSDVIILALHATPPKGAKDVIIASNIGRIGKEADSDDMDVINTGTPKLEINETGDRFEVEQRLKDVSGDTLGAIGVVFPYKAGDNKAALQKKADTITAGLARRISNVANLLEPFPFDPDVSAHNYAQALVDRTMEKHPELLILAIHATSPGHAGYVIIGSNIGRIGKKADEDDMRVIQTGKPNLEVNSTGKRFEVEMQLHDSSGKTIGSLSTVYAYKAGDDKEALHQEGEKIRLEIEKQISSGARLFESS